MKERVFSRIRSFFDSPQIQNNIRGLWVEAMVCELLGDGWRFTGNDWAAWDLERGDGLRVEVKQTARQQTWGTSTSSPRFSIAAAKGHYPDGKTYVANDQGVRLADVYIFAWHDGIDQRRVSEWSFYVVKATKLPKGQKTIALSTVQTITPETNSSALRERLMQISK